MEPLSHFIRQVARGKHGAENLTQDQARQAFGMLMSDSVDPLQLGAFLIAQRMKGETAPELAGFVQAARQHIEGFDHVMAPRGAVDLPCYAGKRRASAAHVAAALRARDAGIPVVVHGVEHIEGRVTAWQLLQRARVSRAVHFAAARAMLDAEGIVYLDLADVCPRLFDIYSLRPRLGVRNFANTVARLLNPMQCSGQLNGFFHTPYAEYMVNANILLQQKRSLIFMGAEGEPELYADRQKRLLAQDADAWRNVAYAEAGLDAYPRDVAPDLSQLMDRFDAMLAGEADAREAHVLARMAEAFAWASSGDLPKQWFEEGR